MHVKNWRLMTMMAAALLFSMSLALQAEDKKEEKKITKEDLINFTKGELTSPKMIEKEDLSLSAQFMADVELSAEHAEKDKKCLKITLSKGGADNAPYGKGKFGVTSPKQPDWSKWEMIKFKAFNASPEIVSLVFIIRDADHPSTYMDRAETTVVLPPGESKQEIFIQGIASNNGNAMNLKKVLEWYFATTSLPEKPIILYFSDMELVTGE